jgi:hypothetical protein
MKSTLIILLAFFIICIVSCKKESDVTIVGKWSIINDSSFLEGSGLFVGGGFNYKGVATDYYDFNSNGNLFIKKGNELDTAKYSLVSNQVTIVYYSFGGITFGSNGAIRGTFKITDLNQHHLTLTLSGLTPEGEELEVIDLKE